MPFSDQKRDNTQTFLIKSYRSDDNIGSDGPESELFVWTNRLRALLIVMAVAQLSNTVSYSCIAPFFPVEANEKGLQSIQTGIVFSSYELVAFFMSPIWGRVIPHTGMKFTFVMGLAGAGVNVILFGFLKSAPNGWPFFALSLLSRSFFLVFASAFATSSYSISAHMFRAKQSRGTLEGFGSVGFALGPTMGGVLYEIGGFELPFFLLGTFILVVACTAFFALPAFKSPTKTIKHNDSYKTPTVFGLSHIPTVWVMYTCVTAVGICFTFVEPTLQPHLEPLGMTIPQVGLFFLILAVSYAIWRPVWGICADRRPQNTSFMQISAALLVALSLLLIGPNPILPLHDHKLWTIGVGLGMFGLALGGLLIPTFDKCIVIAMRNGYTSNVDLYGTVSGLFQSATSLGGFIGPLLGVVLTKKFGFEWGTTCVAGFMVMVVVMLVINKWNNKFEESNDLDELKGILNI